MVGTFTDTIEKLLVEFIGILYRHDVPRILFVTSVSDFVTRAGWIRNTRRSPWRFRFSFVSVLLCGDQDSYRQKFGIWTEGVDFLGPERLRRRGTSSSMLIFFIPQEVVRKGQDQKGCHRMMSGCTLAARRC